MAQMHGLDFVSLDTLGCGKYNYCENISKRSEI